MKAFWTLLTTACLMAAASGAAAADTRLIEAVQQHDAAAVRTLLAEKVDVNASDGDGSTALHWAAANGDAALTQTLLKAGASVKAATRIGGMTPLFMAAKNGDPAVIGLLLQAGASASEANTNGTTVLMAAAASGNAATVTRLLEHGADPNAADATNGQTALMFASARNSADAIRALLAHDADPSIETKVVSLKRVQIDANGDPLPDDAQRPAARASKADERVYGATVVGGMTALQFAAREGHTEAVRALLDGGADVNLVSGGEKTSPIVEAIINGHMDLAKFLLDRGANPNLANIDRLAPLYAAIDMRWRHNTWYPQPTIDQEKTSYLQLMTALLDHGADPNFRIARKLWFRKFRYGDDWVEPIGATPFWRAAQANDLDAMRLLVARGADPNIPTTHGVTPLMVAGGIGFEYQGTNIDPDARLAAVKYLVDELHANVNAADDKKYTTLHGAAYVGDNDLVKYLVAHGANVKARASGRLVGTQGAEDVPAGTGDTVADMSNGPREKSLLHPETTKLLESLGSENSHDCRSTACVNNTKAEKPEKKFDRQ
ncbi:MAG TPA: ankyrin repeat domain-containing protein [Vicinamibacterales bacterium]|nr:ankyrin repeat domain-containing protein [Vicinamibacterales bacterium]